MPLADRLRTWTWRPARAEQAARALELPAGVTTRVLHRHPSLREEDLELAVLGLKDWFVACVHRRDTQLGMPSQAVDWLWHEFILDTTAYERFCRDVFRTYLHHRPEDRLAVSMETALRNTVEAWDRSRLGLERESMLWDLDHRLGMADRPAIELSRAERANDRRLRRNRRRSGNGNGNGGGWFGGGDGGGGGFFGGGDSGGGGDGGGGGCGGGGG